MTITIRPWIFVMLSATLLAFTGVLFWLIEDQKLKFLPLPERGFD